MCAAKTITMNNTKTDADSALSMTMNVNAVENRLADRLVAFKPKAESEGHSIPNASTKAPIGVARELYAKIVRVCAGKSAKLEKASANGVHILRWTKGGHRFHMSFKATAKMTTIVLYKKISAPTHNA